jgi:DNA invertase Pin-like site-specific DNA recombinase
VRLKPFEDYFIQMIRPFSKYVASQRPECRNGFTLHIYAALAEKERTMISERTKAGLAAAKRRGVHLGNLNLAAMNQLKAVARVEQLKPVFKKLADLSASAAAKELNRKKEQTPTGAPWSAKTVLRVRARLGL